MRLTGLSWEWDCLAKFEQNLRHFTCLCPFTNILNGARDDLDFVGLEHILGFNVGFFEGEDGPEIRLEARGTTFGLTSTQGAAMYYPENLQSPATLLESDEESCQVIDALCVHIGGKNHFNLAYIPQHERFEQTKEERFNDVKRVRKAFIALGYGKQMSDALCDKAFHLMKDKSRHAKSVTLLSAQDRLISDRKAAKDLEMKPLSFPSKINRGKDSFLVWHDRELWIAKSKYNMTKGSLVGVQAGTVLSRGVSQSKKEILRQGTVTNLFDAICHLLG